MRLPTASGLLCAWERGLDLAWHDRALLLLEVACPDRDPAELAGLPVGRRDTLLVGLRRQLFGSTLHSVTNCPSCGERLELSFEASDIVGGDPPQTGAELALQVDGHDVTFRLPNSLDVAAAGTAEGPEQQRRAILGRCLLSARKDGRERSAGELPEAVVAAIETRMAEADPQADLQLDVTCPACRRRWSAAFDIVSYLWTEIQAWARRVLQEVHVLASAYGWSEDEILRLHPVKRQAYLQMVCS